MFHLTSKQVHGSSGGQVDPSRTGPGGHVGVGPTHLPPLPCSTVITETQLTALAQEVWAAETMLSSLRGRERRKREKEKIWEKSAINDITTCKGKEGNSTLIYVAALVSPYVIELKRIPCLIINFLGSLVHRFPQLAVSSISVGCPLSIHD